MKALVILSLSLLSLSANAGVRIVCQNANGQKKTIEAEVVNFVPLDNPFNESGSGIAAVSIKLQNGNVKLAPLDVNDKGRLCTIEGAE